MRTLLTLIFIFLAQSGFANCRHALVLALDVSGSVSPAEYELQKKGLAKALLDPEVADIILSDPESFVHLAVFEWSAFHHRDLIQNWITLDNYGTLEDVAQRLDDHQIIGAAWKTGIGKTIQFGFDLLARREFCERRTIDISGDGKNNQGISPQDAYAGLPDNDIVVNALVIGNVTSNSPQKRKVQEREKNELLDYYEDQVIRGQGAFTILIENFDDYAEGIKRKLIRELSPLALSSLPVQKVANNINLR